MNLPRMVTLIVMVCFSIACDGQASLKTPSATTGQLKWDTVNFAMFDIPIFDSINENKWDTVNGTFTMWYDCSNGFVFYYENDVTKKFDTIYPNVPYKDSLNACFLDLILDMRFKKKLTCYGKSVSDSLTLFDQRLNVFETYRSVFTLPDCDPIEDPVSPTKRQGFMKGVSLYGGTAKGLHVIAVKVGESRPMQKWKIIGIAPQKRFYFDGQFLGTVNVFWIKYDEIASAIKMFDRIHPESLISKGI